MKLLVRLALVVLLVLSGSPAFAEPPRIIDVQKTVLHKEFFEIPVLIVPKMGYKFEEIEKGVADKKQKVALEGSVIHMPYMQLLDEISNDALKEGNMEVKSRYSFIWNGSRAELMKIFAEGSGETIGKWVLIVDRGAQKCWVICGSYNAKDMQSAQFVLDMIQSAWWERGAEESGWPLYGSVDTSGTPFRLAGFRQDALVYTKDGKIPTGSSDQALFVVSSPLREYLAPEKRVEYAISEIKKIEKDAPLEIISREEERIAGVPALTITAHTKEESPALIYQSALFHGERVTMLVGIARGSVEDNLAHFQRLAGSYAESAQSVGAPQEPESEPDGGSS